MVDSLGLSPILPRRDMADVTSGLAVTREPAQPIIKLIVQTSDSAKLARCGPLVSPIARDRFVGLESRVATDAHFASTTTMQAGKKQPDR